MEGAVEGGAAHDAHGGFGFEVGGGAHVGDEEIEFSIAIHVTKVGSHTEPGSVRDAVTEDVGKGAVAIVFVPPIGFGKVVADVDVGVAIGIGIPPSDGEAVAVSVDTGLFGSVFERGSAVR